MQKKKQEGAQAGAIVGCVVLFVLLLLCSGVLRSTPSSSSFSSSAPASRPAPSSSWETLTSGIQYDDTTDRHLKDLPSLQGFSDREKEQIISASKKLTHAVNELERERGY